MGVLVEAGHRVEGPDLSVAPGDPLVYLNTSLQQSEVVGIFIMRLSTVSGVWSSNLPIWTTCFCMRGSVSGLAHGGGQEVLHQLLP